MANPFLATISRAPRNLLAKQRFVQITALLVAGVAVLPLGCGGQKSIATLIQELKSPNASGRRHALKQLELRALEAKEAIPFVAECLGDSERDNRYRAAKVLAKIGADATAVPALTIALRDPDVEIRYYVAKSLSEIGPEAEPAVPNLVAALKDKGHEKSYHYIIKALKRVGPRALPAVPALKELSQHPDANLRKDVAAALKSIETS